MQKHLQVKVQVSVEFLLLKRLELMRLATFEGVRYLVTKVAALAIILDGVIKEVMEVAAE